MVRISGTHVGYHEGQDVQSPVYQFSHGDGQDYHLHVMPDENGEPRHIISFAQQSTITNRQDYDGVRVDGGLDVQACQRSKGDHSDLPYPHAHAAYQYYRKDLECLVDTDQLLNRNYVQSDIMDKDGYAVSTVGLSPYKLGGRNFVNKRQSCTMKLSILTSSALIKIVLNSGNSLSL